MPAPIIAKSLTTRLTMACRRLPVDADAREVVCDAAGAFGLERAHAGRVLDAVDPRDEVEDGAPRFDSVLRRVSPCERAPRRGCRC